MGDCEKKWVYVQALMNLEADNPIELRHCIVEATDEVSALVAGRHRMNGDGVKEDWGVGEETVVEV